MQTAINRTFICSVVFLDMVEYSKKPVAEQIFYKERLNTLLTQALANVSPNDRIILDTGDGAALSFLGDPEDALYVSLALREALQGPQPPGPEFRMRLGINLGPVRLVKDINGQPNIIGDGINVAQRVMSFSEPGQIVVSRSFYEVVSCLSEGYGRLFHYEGSRTDKHVREHEIYTVQATSASLQRTATTHPKRQQLSGSGAIVLDKLSQTAIVVTDNLRRKPRLGTTLAMVAILTVAVGLRLGRQPAAAPVASPPSPPQRVAAVPAPAPVKEAVPEKKPAAPSKPAAATAKPATAPSRTAAASSRFGAAPAKSKPATATAGPPRGEEIEEAPAAVAEIAAPATASFAISPWGEVHIDGKMRGISPPLRNVDLTPGRHRIEIRNADFPPHVEIVDAKSGSRIRIRHKFQN
jgi:hypothetical protein